MYSPSPSPSKGFSSFFSLGIVCTWPAPDESPGEGKAGLKLNVKNSGHTKQGENGKNNRLWFVDGSRP